MLLGTGAKQYFALNGFLPPPSLPGPFVLGEGGSYASDPHVASPVTRRTSHTSTVMRLSDEISDPRTVHSIKVHKDLDVDAEMDALDFGLFHAKPKLRVLIYQSMPVVWIGLSMAWPVLLSGFLRLLWCVPIPEGDGMSTLRLLPSPDIICSSDAHELTATLALIGLLVWCLGIPLALFSRVLALRDRRAPETYRRYGYFIQAGLLHHALSAVSIRSSAHVA